MYHLCVAKVFSMAFIPNTTTVQSLMSKPKVIMTVLWGISSFAIILIAYLIALWSAVINYIYYILTHIPIKLWIARETGHELPCNAEEIYCSFDQSSTAVLTTRVQNVSFKSKN